MLRNELFNLCREHKTGVKKIVFVGTATGQWALGTHSVKCVIGEVYTFNVEHLCYTLCAMYVL